MAVLDDAPRSASVIAVVDTGINAFVVVIDYGTEGQSLNVEFITAFRIFFRR